MKTRVGTEGGTRTAETGFSLVEVVVVMGIMALFIVVAMPGLTGYQAKSAVRSAARQLASDIRAAQQYALAQGGQDDLTFSVSGGAVVGYSVTQGATVLWQVTLPTQVHATTAWPGNDIAFTPIGAIVGPGSTPAVCLDDRNGGMITITLVLATGKVQMTQGAGSC